MWGMGVGGRGRGGRLVFTNVMSGIGMIAIEAAHDICNTAPDGIGFISKIKFTKGSCNIVVNIAHPCTSDPIRWHRAKMIQPLDLSRLEHWDDIFDSMKKLPTT